MREKIWLKNSFSQIFPRINTPTFSNLVILHTYPPMKIEQIGCSETSAYKIQTPGNCPEESIQHSGHGESLKSRMQFLSLHRNRSVFLISHFTQNLIFSSSEEVRKCVWKRLHHIGKKRIPFIFNDESTGSCICLRLDLYMSHVKKYNQYA
jgi:hypothetical protein